MKYLVLNVKAFHRKMTDYMAEEIASAFYLEQALVRSLETCSKEMIQEGLSH